MPSIRLAVAEDLTALVNIENAAGFNHWSASQLEESLQNHTIYVVEECGELSGFAIFQNIIDEVELLNIVVSPAQQGQGIGKALLLYALKIYNAQNIERCFLEVAVNNLAAVALYTRLGFEQVGLRKNYYDTAQGKIDAIIMQLDVRRDVCKN